MNISNTTGAFIPKKAHPPKAFQPAAAPELEQAETFVKSQERSDDFTAVVGGMGGCTIGAAIGAMGGGVPGAFIGLIAGFFVGAAGLLMFFD